jgi:hypothetical protein
MNTPLPDAVCEADANGDAVLVMNKRARLFLNKHLSGKVRWHKVARTADGAIGSPEYRAIAIEPGPVVAAILCSLHEAGLRALVYCDECEAHHVVEGETAKHLKMTALTGAGGVLPPHPTPQ